MGLALFKERRLTDRRQLTGLLPGRLVFATGRADVNCRPVDVSANGMGIVVNSQKQIEPGTDLLLMLADGPVQLKVAWVHPDFGKQDFFRYGLVTVDPEVDLTEVFVRTGCLR